jgi:Ca-activated chloride channel family protein
MRPGPVARAISRWRGARRAAVLRVVAAVGLALVLAGVCVRRARPAGGACVILAVDVSASVQHAGLDAVTRMLPVLGRALRPRDIVGAVVFARDARVVVAPTSTPPTAQAIAEAAEAAGLDRDASDLSAAIRLAGPLCPDGVQPALLLFSDGQETRGNAVAESVLAEPPMPVFPVTLDATELPAVVIRRVLAPPTVADRVPVPLEAVVESHAPAPVEAALVLAADDGTRKQVPATLLPGLTVVALPYRARGPGRHGLDAALRSPPDGPLLPGAVHVSLDVVAAPHVLVGAARSSSVVAEALAERGMQVDVVTASVLASRLGRLTAGDVVVLDDVGRGDAASLDVPALARWVARGGALVVTGGPHLFGDPGWASSALAPLLPVELLSQAPEPKEREPIALELVIDRSNSMGFSTRPDPGGEGEKMEYARRAALAVLDQLGSHDLVGAIAFDSQPYELGPLVPVADGRDALAMRIRALRHGGGTDFKDALDIARRNLVNADRAVRHIILLTDGDTNRRSDDHFDLIAALARDEITVTSIRIGSDTGNLDLLQQISRETGGEFHHVADATALPQLMIRDTRRLIDAPGSLVNAPARIAEWGPMLAGLPEEDFPVVARWAATRLKDDAELRLYLDAGSRRDPLLATWQYQLGRVAVVPVDFQSGAAEWAGWEGFGKLWAQLVLWTLPPPAEAAAHPPDDEAVGRELRTVGSNLPLLHQLAAATGGVLDPTPEALLAARPGVEHESVPLAPFLLPLEILAVLGDNALLQLGR